MLEKKHLKKDKAKYEDLLDIVVSLVENMAAPEVPAWFFKYSDSFFMYGAPVVFDTD